MSNSKQLNLPLFVAVDGGKNDAPNRAPEVKAENGSLELKPGALQRALAKDEEIYRSITADYFISVRKQN